MEVKYPILIKGGIIIKVDKEYICKLLNIKKDTLRKIENKNGLCARLNEIGYKLISKIKEGRKVYYEIEQYNNKKEIYKNMVKYVYKTNKKDQFSNYFILRTINNDKFPLNKRDIAEKAEVSTKTIATWDNRLIDNKIISKDGYFYFCINKDTGEITQCTHEEYKTFWRNKYYIDAFKDLQLKYIKGQITLDQLTLASAEIGATIALIQNKYYYRSKKYKTNEDNLLFNDTMKLICDIYGKSE